MGGSTSPACCLGAQPTIKGGTTRATYARLTHSRCFSGRNRAKVAFDWFVTRTMSVRCLRQARLDHRNASRLLRSFDVACLQRPGHDDHRNLTGALCFNEKLREWEDYYNYRELKSYRSPENSQASSRTRTVSPASGDADKDWSRWYRRSIEKSAQQLCGAKRVVRSRETLYVNASLKARFPLTLLLRRSSVLRYPPQEQPEDDPPLFNLRLVD